MTALKEPASPDNRKPDLSSAELVKSYVISLVISIPCIGITYFLANVNTDWPMAHGIFGIIMLVSVVNFVALVALEEYRSKLGSFTIPAMIAATFIVLLIVVIVAISRYVPSLHYQWLFPVIFFVIAFKYLAMFREKNLALKFYLAVNIIALAALWGLGIQGKISLPF